MTTRPLRYHNGQETRTIKTNGERYAVLGAFGIIGLYEDRKEAANAVEAMDILYDRWSVGLRPQIYRLQGGQENQDD